MRDLKMDVDNINTRMAMNAYKEFADVELAEENEKPSESSMPLTEATMMSALF